MALAVWPVAAELPEFYKSVDRVIWVVEDLDRAVAAWEKLGVLRTKAPVEVDAPVTFRGAPTNAPFRWAVGRFGDTTVDFVQPRGGSNAFADFAKRHGQGVMGLLHRVDSVRALETEIARMRGLGVEVLQSSSFADEGGREVRYALFDTEGGGKYTIGVIYVQEGYAGPLTPPAAAAGDRKVTQYAFAVRDLQEVGRYWERLGWPAMEVTVPDTSELEYRGKPGAFGMRLGWHRHGKVPYEWILSTKEPNVYVDHIKVHGEGVHHLAFNTDNIDAAAKEWTAAGFPTSQSGAWGAKGQRGSGRFSYQDAHAVGGIDVELLWSYRGAR